MLNDGIAHPRDENNIGAAQGVPNEREMALFALKRAVSRLKSVQPQLFDAEMRREFATFLQHFVDRGLLDELDIHSGLVEAAAGNAASLQALNEFIPPPRIIVPRPYEFPAPASIPPRPKIMGDDYLRGYVSATVAPGGVGKSAIITAEALALVTGKRKLVRAPRRPMRVWYIGEDDMPEQQRRFAAAMKYYGVRREDVGDRLFVESFRDQKFMIAAQYPGGVSVNFTDVRAIIRAISSMKIDVLIIDPLVKFHRVTENDNMGMEEVYSTCSDIAHQSRCAVHLVIHTRKAVAGQPRTIEDIRGASAQLGAVRSARLIVRMEESEANAMGIDPKDCRLYIRVGDTKANMLPPAAEDTWFKLHGVFLGNASSDPDADNQEQDNVQVVDLFKVPGLFQNAEKAALDQFMREIRHNPRRASDQCEEWAGHLLAELLGMDSSAKPDRPRLKRMLKTWEMNKCIVRVSVKDENRDIRPHLTIGPNWDFS